MSARLWINQWSNPLNVCRGTVPSAQILFYWIYGAQSEINFHFMTHSFRSLSLSGPLHPSIIHLWRFPVKLPGFISHCGSLATPENLSLVHYSCVCAPLVLLPFTFMLTFSFLSPSEQEVFLVRSLCGIFRMMNNDSPRCSAQIPPHVFIARSNYHHCRHARFYFCFFNVFEHKNYAGS